MKSFLILIFSGFTMVVCAQTTDTLFVTKLNDANWTKDYSNSTKFEIIKFEDGTVFMVGDKMKLGNPSSSNQSYQQNSGLIGSTSQSVNNFSYLMLGKMGSAILTGITFLPETFKGAEVEIEEIKIAKGRKNQSSGAVLIFQNPYMDITVLNLKLALEYGELINPKAAMTSDQALAELQKAKTKLDLGVISKEEYEVMRVDLMKYIK